MSINYPSIEQYLVSICLLIIDELNELYGNLSKDKLKEIADNKFNEMDITVRLGYPFRNMVHYTVGDSTKTPESKSNHDLYIASKDYKIEVKYLKNWKCGTGTKSSSKTWSEYLKDFNWLFSEIDAGQQNKRAFIIGWFNCVDSFSRLMQLGKGKGQKPLVDEEKYLYFPFLNKSKVPTYTADLDYNYALAYQTRALSLVGKNSKNYNCMFLGNENDCFHFAIYY